MMLNRPLASLVLRLPLVSLVLRRLLIHPLFSESGQAGPRQVVAVRSPLPWRAPSSLVLLMLPSEAAEVVHQAAEALTAAVVLMSPLWCALPGRKLCTCHCAGRPCRGRLCLPNSHDRSTLPESMLRSGS